jgi:hypothetical protein
MNTKTDKYNYYLTLDLGGQVECDVYFNIVSDDEDDPDWIVDDYLLLFLGLDVTNMVSNEAVEEKIYEKRKEVEDLIRNREGF